MTSSSSSIIQPPKKMVSVSLTNFIDYAMAKDPQQRLTVVKKVKRQMEKGYSPKRDYYKVPRDSIQKADGLKVDFDSLPVFPDRSNHWREIITGYNKFIGRKKFTARLITRKEWVYSDLVVSVNPEIALEFEGITTYYKLYFKTESLSKRSAHTIYQIMIEMIDPNSAEDIGIIDLRNGRVISQPSPLPDSDLAALLRADAVGFVSLWNNL